MPSPLYAALLAITLAGSLCAQSTQPAAATAWPSFVGPDASRTPAPTGLKLVDDLQHIKPAWVLKRHMGVGKGLYPRQLQAARAMGIEPFYGGTASPIVAEGLVFLSYYKPDGKHPADRKGWRTMAEPDKLALLPDWFYSVTADDITIAVDLKTGALRWEAVEAGKGLNRLAHKRDHVSLTPAYANGRVFVHGSLGRVYAYEATTGKRLWETPPSPFLQKVRDDHIAARKLCWQNNQESGLQVAGDVVIVSNGSLTAYDQKTGQLRWQTAAKTSVQSNTGTPLVWRHRGRDYLLARDSVSTARLIDPADGQVLWTLPALGPELGTPAIVDDVLIVNGTSEHAVIAEGGMRSGKPGWVLHAGYQLSLEGARKLWSLPDTHDYWHAWTADKGARFRITGREGVAFLVVNRAKESQAKHGGPDYCLLRLDIKTGRVLEKQDISKLDISQLYWLEDRLLTINDDAHSNPVDVSWWDAGGPKLRPLNERINLPHYTITGYIVNIQYPYIDGLLICRSMEGLHCYDLRK